MAGWSPAEFGVLWWTGIGVLGLVVGIVSGMFGVGGNFMLIPLLSIGFRVPLPIAVGTGLCQVIGSSTAALIRYSRLKQGETLIDWIMMGGAIVGANLGAVTLGYLSGVGEVTFLGHRVTAVKLVLSLTFTIVLLLVALGMARDVRMRPTTIPLGPGPLTRIHLPPTIVLPRSGRVISVIVLAYIGFVLAFLNSLVGMGGGVVLLPVLIYGIGLRIRMAAATGIRVLVVASVVGAYVHAGLGHVHLGLAIMLLAGSTIGAPIGATITSHVNGRHLRATFAAMICLTALAVLWDLIRVLLRS